MKRKNNYSPRRKWSVSQLSQMLGDNDKPCKCKCVDFKRGDADWIMCPDCGRIWIRNERK